MFSEGFHTRSLKGKMPMYVKLQEESQMRVNETGRILPKSGM